jgi:hypothetical protein
MAMIVVVVDRVLPPLDACWRLAVLLPVGATAYATWMLVFARSTVRELVALVRYRTTPV